MELIKSNRVEKKKIMEEAVEYFKRITKYGCATTKEIAEAHRDMVEAIDDYRATIDSLRDNNG